jgi:hypothetical protein
MAVRRRASPRKFLRILPATYSLFIGCSCLIVCVNIGELLLDEFSPTSLTGWLAWTTPLTHFMAGYVLAIGHISQTLANTNAASRIPLLTNLIAFSWLFAFAGIFGAPFTIFWDYRHGNERPRRFAELANTDDIEIGLKLMGAIILSVATFGLLYTGVGYISTGRQYFKSDIGLLTIAFLFSFLILWIMFIEATAILFWCFKRRLVQE